MSLGSVQVNKLNLLQGELRDVERFFLFIGRGNGTNEGSLLNVNNDSDMDVLLGAEACNLKTQVQAAKVNAGQNWNAAVYPLEAAGTWADAVDYAMEHMSCEAIVITDAVTSSAEIEAMQAKAEAIMGQYMRPMIFIPTCTAIDPATESWSDFTTSRNALLNDLACDQVNPVATIWPDDQGVYCGRLCDNSVTIADSPMRVITGAVVGIRSIKPMDMDDIEISMANLTAMDAERWSVPQWYPDYPGVYFGDGNVLDIPGGDFQVIEHLRVVHKAMRKVYLLAVPKVADRKLNSTPASISSHESYFMRPLREMSKSVEILGTTFPGEIEPPKDGDIVIKWITKTSVSLYMAARPYNCPKKITCNILLDLTNYAE
ncbi:MAG: DUF2586 domain-containing protein [Pseudodesulfovibrio sp.]|nr:DUF2586 domain-containing protein [Pseudodesulfovibrio sp.]